MVRFKLALTEDWPTVKTYDEAAWAKLSDSTLPIDGSLMFIDALHARWVALLESLSEAGFPKGLQPSRPRPPNPGCFAGPLRLARPPPHRAHHQPPRAHGLVDIRFTAWLTGADAPSPARLAQTIAEYLADHPAAALLEDGRVLFDMRMARYAVSESHGRCLLEVWSEERNLVRTVVEVQERAQCLRMVTRRMGAAKPQTLELAPTSDRRTPTARDTARRNYQRLLERVLARSFIGAKVDGFRSAMDLEHSFGPAYVRGRLLRGVAADAVIGVGRSRICRHGGRRAYPGHSLARLLPPAQ